MDTLTPYEIPARGGPLPPAIALAVGTQYLIPNDGQLWLQFAFEGFARITLARERGADTDIAPLSLIHISEPTRPY